MYPTLKPGDKVVVTSIVENSLPEPGAVVVIAESDMHILHRLVDILQAESKERIITRGDSMTRADPPHECNQIVGIAYSLTRKGRYRKLRRCKPPEIFYLQNKILLSTRLLIRSHKAS